MLLVLPLEQDAALFRPLLAEAGYDFTNAGSAEAALSLAEDFDVVVLAANPPDGSWRELLRAVLRCPPEQRPGFILLADAAHEESLLEALDGFGQVVTKPAEPEEILWALADEAASLQRRRELSGKSPQASASSR